MKYTFSTILILVSITLFGIRISKKVEFEQNVSGYLKRAADANTIALANEELTKVIDYLEANNLTSGHTSIFYKTPNEDIDFWYRNLKASQQELANLKTESALEKTNVLMKLRETLIDNGKRTRVTIPKGLAVYPNNALWAILMLIATLSAFASFILLVAQVTTNAKQKS